ncbi:unnamed protein product [Spirodela intermedia]|uniref:Dof zinc finger protein n=1 Tax=Spirodela intermedia TaxID=51605 RepID=A0A7I8K5E2_SPIIN|nr:unnamed protein product [Spirodela intermedia]
MVFSSVPAYLDPPNWNQLQSGHHQRATGGGGGGGGGGETTQMPPTAGTSSARPCSMAERARLAKVAQPEAALKCPRCDSTNTKFCYFNNYSLSQPRHFCKTCRRYWTRGGALRNVPVGGGCRRNKRSKSTGSGGGGSRNSGGSSAGGGGAITPSFQPPPQLPFMAPLQHLVDYEMHFPVDTVDFQLGGRGGVGLEQWRLQQVQQQFSLLAGMEPPAAAPPSSSAMELFPFDGELPSVKMEDPQGLNLPRHYLGVPGSDQYWHGGGGGGGGSDMGNSGGIGGGGGWTDFQSNFL